MNLPDRGPRGKPAAFRLDLMEWAVVRKMPVGDAGRFVWPFVWDEAGGRPGVQVHLSPIDLAKYACRGHQYGYRAVEDLVKARLVRVLERGRAWRLEVLDPTAAARTLVQDDGQRELFEDIPESVPIPESFSIPAFPITEASETEVSSSSARSLPEASEAEHSGIDTDSGMTLASTLRHEWQPRVLDRLGKEQGPAREAKVRELVEHILRRVNCLKMLRKPAQRVAWAVTRGDLEWADVAKVLDNLDKATNTGTLRETRSQYFNGTIRKIFADKNIPWWD